MKNLKFVSYSVAMQEVPDEVSLVINISGCPYKCEGCHSDYLRTYSGEFLIENVEKLYLEYKDLISCVCFMGGDQNKTELIIALKWFRTQNLKTCLYTGTDNISNVTDLIPYLDYIKMGHYSKELGGLGIKTTNQRMYKITNGYLTDITSRFWK